MIGEITCEIKISKRKNKWCVLLNTNLGCILYGLGKSLKEALKNYKKNFNIFIN